MGLFSGLSEKLNHIFSKLTKKGKLTELEIKEAMREVKLALLEADVNFLIVKKFVSDVSEKAVGEKVLKSLTPGQQVIKIVNEELTALMGSSNQKLAYNGIPTVYMMCGLQGAGKTTMTGKLAYMLKGQGKKVLLVAADIYRPAAIEQLKVVGAKAGAEVFEMGKTNPVKIAKLALEKAEKERFDYVIIDTAGRLQINEELMQELAEIKKAVNPTEILLTVDAMTGQEAANVASSFNEKLDITGVILTKLDGDTRGGAALSIKAITGKPIKLIGTGEKLGDLEVFHPDRMANRILGMGDVLTLIEKAEALSKEQDVAELEKKLRENSFTLEDLMVQMESMKKMGNINDIVGMIPGLGGKLNGAQIDEKMMDKSKAIIQSMTPKERRNPDIIKASHKMRIAKGSGTTIQDINRLLKQYNDTKEMMKRFKNGKMPKGFRF